MRVFALLFTASVVFSSEMVGRTKAGEFTYLGSLASQLTQGNNQTDFLLSSEMSSWENAFNICREELGGRLLSIESQAKETKIKEYLTGYTLDYVWTSGLFDAGEQTSYWLTSLHLLEYTNWKAGVTPSTGPAYRVAYYNALRANWQSLPMSNLNRFICELEPIAEPCFETKDLTVVLDGSGNMSPESFVKAQDFIAKLARAFTVYDPTKLGFIVYSDYATVEVPLKNALSPGQIEEGIVTAQQPQGSRNTSGGIDTALELLGSPQGISRVMVVITSGASNNRTATFASAAAAIQAGIISFSVGIGSYSSPELLAIADNDLSKVFTTDAFDNLIHLLAPLGHKICETRK